MKGLVFDSETVPIIEHPFYEKYFNSEEKKSIMEEYNRYKNIAEEKGYGFVSHPPFNAIVALAWSLLEINNDEIIIKKSGGTCHQNERLIVSDFINYINSEKPDLYIHFNGKNYDVPLMIFKSAFYNMKITHKKFLNLYKFSNEHHYDLKDVLTNYGSYPLNLRTLSLMLKNGDPKENCSGEEVLSLWKKNAFSSIENYCKKDVSKTTDNFKKLYYLFN